MIRTSHRHTAALSALLVASVAWAAPLPKNLSSHIRKINLTENDREVIQQFAEAHLEILENGEDVESQQRARRKLTGDLIGPSGKRATPIFRDAYAEVLLPRLKPIMAGDDVPTSIAAAQIMGALETDAALSALAPHLSSQNEPRAAVRLWAAASMKPLITSPNVSSDRAMWGVNALAEAASEEPSWAAMRRQMDAISVAVTNDRPADEGRDALSRKGCDAQAQALQAAINRFANGDVEAIRVIEPHMMHIQQQFLDQNDAALLGMLSQRTAPVLGGMYEAVLAQWPAITADQMQQQLAGSALDQAEVMIVLMDNHLTGSSNQAAPQYKASLKSGDQAPIKAGKDRWGSLANRPSYGG